jgi:hypothetical protein
MCYIDSSELSGSGSVWLERCVRDAEVGGSNPLSPIFVVRELLCRFMNINAAIAVK